jgi:hypothetical protein
MASRELIFETKQLHNQAQKESAHTTAITEQLLDEAQQGVQLVSNGRKALITYQMKNIKDVLDAAQNRIGLSLLSSIGLVKDESFEPSSLICEIGYPKSSDSNVSANDGNAELLANDRKQGFINSASDLYRANINMPLPTSLDNSVSTGANWHLSALPAPILGAVSPARLARMTKFKPVKSFGRQQNELSGNSTFLPSATKITISKKAGLSKVTNDPELSAVAIAITAGAMPFP